MAASLLNRALDFGFAIFLLRVLGPTEVGRYTWAVLVVGYLDILINFGFGVLVTRDVARSPEQAGRYLGGALLVRSLLWAVSLCVALLIAGPLAAPLDLTPHMGLTLALLTLGIGISNLSGLASALFYAAEQMEYPAVVTILTSLMKIALGVIVLGLGHGIVGLAVVAIVVNAITAFILVALLVIVRGRIVPVIEARFGFGLMGAAYPLMINNLLATVFFRIDGLMLRASWGDTVLGWYGTAYRFIDGFNALSSSFTLALFPVMSRLASPQNDNPPTGTAQRPALLAATELGLRVLFSLAFPIAMGTTLLADPIIRIFAGDSYLPHSAVALQLLLWLMPLSFANGLLQYVLIAVDQQRFITVSFLIATSFNVAANAVVIPHSSYVGAAAVTIASELVLLLPFWWALGRHVGPVRLLRQGWRAAIAAVLMAGPVALLRDLPLLAFPVGLIVYLGALIWLGGVTREERRAIAALARVGFAHWR
jgi:O-antigen/teichoic acid export membrane protein